MPGATKLVVDLQVWDERDERLGEAHFARPVEVYMHPCLGGVLEEDGDVSSCKPLGNDTIEDNQRTNLGDFRVDLGRLGQERDDPPPVAAWLEIDGIGFSLTSLIRSPEVADVGAVDEDEGRPDEVEGLATGAEWARRTLSRLGGEGEVNWTDAPALPNDALDPTRAALRPRDALTAPPRYEPGWAPPRRVVHVWKRLTDVKPHFAPMQAKLAQQALRTGVSGVAIYATSQAADGLVADPGVKRLMDRGRLLVVRWEDLPRPLNWLDYDQQFFNAHASLSHWGRNVALFVSDVDEVLTLPPTLAGPGSDARPDRRQAEDRAIARVRRSAAWRRCHSARLGSGIYSTVGETRLQDRKASGLPLCSPDDGMPSPTPRQRRLADVLAFGGCRHEQERAEMLERKGAAHAALLRAPRCATMIGRPIYFSVQVGADGEVDRRSDGERIAAAPSALQALGLPSITAHDWRWQKPLVLPDSTFAVWVHTARSCEVSRTQPWGRPAAEGYGVPLPLARLADGTWDLESTGVPQRFSNADERPPPIRSACRISQQCGPVAHECISLLHFVDLHGPRHQVWTKRISAPWQDADVEWLWVWDTPDSEIREEKKPDNEGAA